MRRELLLFMLTAVACNQGDDTADGLVPSDIDTDTDTDTDTDVPEEPAAEVAPQTVDAGVVCGSASAEVSVSSVGDGALEVSDVRTSGDWDATAGGLPWVLDPVDKGIITVDGFGDGELTIITSAGEVAVPLSATVDVAPTVTWLAPEEGAVMPVSTVTELQVEVAGATDLTWASDVDGELASTTVTDGLASFAWDAALQSPGLHILTATASDDCTQVTADRGICQQLGYTEDGVDLATWETVGTAYWDEKSDYLVLTTAGAFQAGSAFQTTEALSADNINIQFQLYAGNNDGGADGMSLTVLDAERMTTFIGGVGLGLGYYGLPAWSLEFDTYCNGGLDATCEDHIAFSIDGDVYAAQHTTAIGNIEDDQWHDVQVIMDGNDLTVIMDEKTILTATVKGKTAFQVYVGFTAATGSYANSQLIDSLTVTNYVCDE